MSPSAYTASTFSNSTLTVLTETTKDVVLDFSYLHLILCDVNHSMNSPHYAPLHTQTLGLAATNQEWYTLLTSGLTPEQKEKIQKLFVTAEQRKAARGMYTITIHVRLPPTMWMMRICSGSLSVSIRAF